VRTRSRLSVAGRYDRYSTTSDPTVPKYSLRWMPISNEFAVRGTYSESFVAPTLYDLYGPLSAGFTSSINVNRFDANGNSMGVATGSRQYRSQTGSNSKLNPSQSRNWTAGIVWSPKAIRGFSVSADWFNIDERDLVSSIPDTTIVKDVEQNGAKSPYASLVRLATSTNGESHFSDGAPITAPGQMTSRPSDEVWISNSIVNVAGYWQQGMDLSMNYKWSTDRFGRFRRGIRWHVPPRVRRSKSARRCTRGISGRILCARHQQLRRVPALSCKHSGLDWSLRNLTASVAHTYVPEVDDLTNVTPYRVAEYQTVDFQVGYNFTGSHFSWARGLQTAIGINNAFNRMPPRIPSEGNQSHDINAYDPIGRFVYVQARYKF
jgi:iron complex outermembrane receptor protein